jgi:Leucine-rich repeat (LRR) protein
MSSNLTPNLSITSLPSAVATAKLLALVTEQRKQSKDDGNTLNLRNLGIAETLPPEVIEMIKDEVSRYAYLFWDGAYSRLDLAQNMLFHFDSEFKKLTRLRYLDIRSNKFREFPDVVRSCR